MIKKFICNGMLGKLCKLLRICGIDTLYSNEGMKILLEARKEGRIILTRNTHLGSREGVYFIKTSHPSVQLKDVINKYKLQNEIKPFSRCVECNEELKPIDKEIVRDKIPYFTYKNFEEFAMCPNCQKIYWKGSHYKKMLKEILPLIPKTKNKCN